jgi:beta-lactamase class A
MVRLFAVACVFQVLTTSALLRAEDPGARVAAVTKDFKGTVSIYAKHLGTGREFAVRADEKVRTASTIKLPILCALEAQVARGAVRWADTVTLRDADKIGGSGVLASLSDGSVFTLRDLAILMIVVSDNTATNLVLDRIGGADVVNDYLDTLGLTATRALRKVRGDGPGIGWSRAGRLPENEKYGLGVTRPREMVRLLELIHAGKVVSPDASKDILGVLQKQQLKDGIGRHAGDTVASKSGSLDALRSDVGIVTTKGGPIAIAITVDDMPTVDYSPDNAGNKLIWELSKAIVDALSQESPASID